MKDLHKPYFVGTPNIGNKERFVAYVDKIFTDKWLTNNGSLLLELEQKLADYIGVKHCVAMCNGTIALEIAIRANDLRGEVIIPSMTFIATAHALQWQGINPVFADISHDTLNLDPKSVENVITDETSGIIGVHLYGRSCDINALEAIADTHGLKLLFDAAHSLGCSHNGRRIGNFGSCEVLSFHATKVFNSFEGGAVTTNDDELAAKIRLMRNFGFEGEDNVSYIGINGKMTEICAAMGLTNFESLDKFISKNESNYQIYHQRLDYISGISLVPYIKTEQNNFQYVVILVDSLKYGRSRDELKTELEGNNIIARRYFYPGCHRMEPYKTLYPNSGQNLPVTEHLSKQVLALPTGTQLSAAGVAKICDVIERFSS